MHLVPREVRRAEYSESVRKTNAIEFGVEVFFVEKLVSAWLKKYLS
jgi:hypothetical protein